MSPDCRPLEELANVPISNVVIKARPGCGKTSALACRTAAMVRSGSIAAQQRVLCITFSNKARDNLASRLGDTLGVNYRRFVTVTNFHGLAARFIRAHGDLVGLDPSISFPEQRWRAALLAELDLDRDSWRRMEQSLRDAKRQPLTDDQVGRFLTSSGATAAREFERLRIRQGRLDYDDLLRYAELLLANKELRRTYRLHFPAVVVDEVQDLTPQQLRIVETLGSGRLTAAGDPTQGIYGFAGADSPAVFAALDAAADHTFELSKSHRSSPQVLDAVNAIGRLMKATDLDCADPGSWPDAKPNSVLVAPSAEDEAMRLVPRLQQILSANPGWRIAVIVRANDRFGPLATELERQEQSFEAWNDPTHSPKLIGLLKDGLRLSRGSSASSQDALMMLVESCGKVIDPTDTELLDALAVTAGVLQDRLAAGMTLGDAVARCRSESVSDSRPVAPGIHLLNAHVGKGQEFDWVVVLGLEEGLVPDSRARTEELVSEELRVLHVMVSRARHGLTFTRVANWRNRSGAWRREPSRWFKALAATASEEW